MTTKRTLMLIVGLALLGSSAGAAEKIEPDGYLYGTVETESDHRYTGFLRWGTEEAFWDDLFNSTKDELPYLDEHGEQRRERNRIKIFGVTVGYRWHDSHSSRIRPIPARWDLTSGFRTTTSLNSIRPSHATADRL